MDIQERRTNLARFIVGTFGPDDLDRAKRDSGNQIGRMFRTYNDFRNHQIYVANNIDINTFNFAEQLMLLIENMVMAALSGFMFINGRFVTFNER
jgi:hypothetical protein